MVANVVAAVLRRPFLSVEPSGVVVVPSCGSNFWNVGVVTCAGRHECCVSIPLASRKHPNPLLTGPGHRLFPTIPFLPANVSPRR